jgi:hypothetical protein
MNEDYDTVELTREDLIESLEMNLNDLTTRTGAIIDKLKTGAEIEPQDIDDTERLASFVASNLNELRLLLLEGKEK